MRRILLISGLLLFVGCEKKHQIDYTPLDAMYSTNIDALKKMKVTELEIAQLGKLKQAGATDDLCVALFKVARAHGHDFTSGEGAIELSQAGYSDGQIQEMAESDQIDVLSGDAITLKLIGLSNSTVQEIIHRRIQGLPTMTSEQIGRLKNIAISEKQILIMVDGGLTGDEADRKIVQLEASRNHSNTSFVRNQGRRRR
jgi:hypothetical protein